MTQLDRFRSLRLRASRSCAHAVFLSRYAAWCSTTNSPSLNRNAVTGSLCSAHILLCASGAYPPKLHVDVMPRERSQSRRHASLPTKLVPARVRRRRDRRLRRRGHVIALVDDARRPPEPPTRKSGVVPQPRDRTTATPRARPRAIALALVLASREAPRARPDRDSPSRTPLKNR